MIPGDRPHKTKFCKKTGGGGLTKTFLIKRGVGAKGGELEQFHILRGVGQKEGVTFLRGASNPGAHYASFIKKQHYLLNYNTFF